jgi:DNA-directed RNA polymerase specialized sigma24 family protein
MPTCHTGAGITGNTWWQIRPMARSSAPVTIAAVDIGAALAALPPRQRALVVLRHMEDMSISEAAELLGVTDGTVKVQSRRQGKSGVQRCG